MRGGLGHGMGTDLYRAFHKSRCYELSINVASFARAVQNAGLTWIGPPPEAIERMGDKVEARKIMSAAGVPVVPGSPGTLETEAEVAAIAKKIGFPIMVKAAAGGGGKGLRFVESDKDLASIVRTVCE